MAIKDNKIHITKPYVDVSTKKLCITFSKAIYKSGKVMGVIGVDVFVDSVIKLLKGIESSQNANLYIIDNDGLINFSKDRTEIGKNIATVFHTTTDVINEKTNKVSDNSKKEYAKYINIIDETGKQNEMYLTSVPGYDWKTIVFINPNNIKNANQDKFNKSTPFIPVLIFLLLILVIIIIQNYLNRRQLLHNLNHDFLTKLPNRNNFEKTIRRTIPKCKNGTKALLILMDVDNFKFFNDTIGNINADKIIVSLSQLIKKNANRNCYVCRVGGDEFAVIIRNISYEKARTISEDTEN